MKHLGTFESAKCPITITLCRFEGRLVCPGSKLDINKGLMFQKGKDKLHKPQCGTFVGCVKDGHEGEERS